MRVCVCLIELSAVPWLGVDAHETIYFEKKIVLVRLLCNKHNTLTRCHVQVKKCVRVSLCAHTNLSAVIIVAVSGNIRSLFYIVSALDKQLSPDP